MLGKDSKKTVPTSIFARVIAKKTNSRCPYFQKIVAVPIFLFLVAQLSFSAEDEDFSLAEGAYSDGLYEIAGKQFEKFIMNLPGSKKLPEAHFFLAECEFKQGNFSKAREEYTLASKSHEVREEALYLIGKCFFGEEDFPKTVSTFDEFLRSFPESKFAPTATYWLAEALTRQDKFEKACEVYLQLQKKYPGSPYVKHALLSRGICLIEINLLGDAISSFKTVIAKFPDSKLIPCAQFSLGQAYLLSGRFKEAQLHFEKILKDFPENRYADDAQYAIGLTLFKAGNSEEAIEGFKKVVSSFPESRYVDEAQYAICYVHEVCGKLDEAIILYRQVLEKFPESSVRPPALYHLGICYMNLEKEEEAISTLEDLLNNYPQSEWAQKARPLTPYQSGNSSLSRGKFIEAVREYKKLIDGDFGGEWEEKGHFYVAASLFKGRKYKDAIDAFKLFVEKFPDSEFKSQATCCIGQSLFNMGKYKEARTFFEKVEDKDISRMKIGDCLAREGLLKEAMVSYNSVRGEISNLARFEVGKLLYQEGRFQKAGTVFKPLINGESYISDDAQYWFAGCMLHLGKIEEAQTYYADFIEKFPGSELLSGAFFNLGNIQYHKESYQEAIDIYQKLGKLFPDAVEGQESHFRMGLCQLELGNPGEAEVLFREYISLWPHGRSSVQAKLWLGQHSYEKKEFAKAKDILLSLINSPEKEGKADAHYWLGRCFEEENKYEQAMEEFNKIMKNFPGNPRITEVKLRIGNLLTVQGKDDQALKIYREIIKEGENEFMHEGYFHMGKTLQKLGRYREAVRIFEKIGETGDEKQEAEIQFRIGSCYHELGEFEEAILEYLKVVYLYPACFDLVLKATESAAICFEKQGKTEEAVSLYKKILEADPDGVKGELARQKIEEMLKGEEND